MMPMVELVGGSAERISHAGKRLGIFCLRNFMLANSRYEGYVIDGRSKHLF